MPELPSNNNETDLGDRIDLFEELPLQDSDDENEVVSNNEHILGNVIAEYKENQYLSETDFIGQNSQIEFDIDASIITDFNHTPASLPVDFLGYHEELLLANVPTEHKGNQNLSETDFNDQNPQCNVSPLPVDSVPAVIVEIRKSTSKKREGYYKTDGDVIVTKRFLVGKVKRINFQTVDVINHGDVVKITVEAKKLGEKFVPQPRLVLENEIPEEFKCGCFTSHLGSPFCVISENATVDSLCIDDNFLIILKPTKPEKMEFEIGFRSADFGKDYVTKLEFQLERVDKKSFHQRYFVKTCADPGRDLKKFIEKVNLHFANRYKWYEEGFVSVDEPQLKKMRLSQTVEPPQLNPLLVECPAQYETELMNLLKYDSQYGFIKW